VTVKSARYCAVPDVSERDADDVDGELCSQQHGGTAHTARKSMDCLTAIFSGRALKLSGDVAWPARSPEPLRQAAFSGDTLKPEGR
jgi:hypothetical protein